MVEQIDRLLGNRAEMNALVTERVGQVHSKLAPEQKSVMVGLFDAMILDYHSRVGHIGTEPADVLCFQACIAQLRKLASVLNGESTDVTI